MSAPPHQTATRAWRPRVTVKSGGFVWRTASAWFWRTWRSAASAGRVHATTHVSSCMNAVLSKFALRSRNTCQLITIIRLSHNDAGKYHGEVHRHLAMVCTSDSERWSVRQLPPVVRHGVSTPAWLYPLVYVNATSSACHRTSKSSTLRHLSYTAQHVMVYGSAASAA